MRWVQLLNARRRSVLISAVLLLVGVALRWWILETWWGYLNADEAVTGLGAFEALHGRLDVVIPGNAYTANLESYLFAPVAAVFGGRIVALKILPITLWALASVALYRLGRRVIEPVTAAVGASMLWLAPGALLIISTRSYLAYAGGMLIVAIALTALIKAIEPDGAGARTAFWAGLVCGLGVYVHPMYLAVITPAVIMVGLRRRRHWRTWWLPAATGALLLNLPWLAWNVRHGYPSFRGDVADSSRGTYLVRLGRLFSGMLTRDLGVLNEHGDRWTFGPIGSIAALVLVLAIAGGGAVRLWRANPGGRLLAVTCVSVWPAMAAFSALGYVEDGRYGVVMAVPFFACLGAGIGGFAAWIRRGRVRPGTEITWVGGVIVVGMWLIGLVVPSIDRMVGRTWDDPNGDYYSVLYSVQDAGMRAIAGNYWAVLPITYVSDGEMPSAVVAPDPVRYPEYQRRAERTPPLLVAFVFWSWNENPTVLTLPLSCYERQIHGGLVAYLPDPTCPLG